MDRVKIHSLVISALMAAFVFFAVSSAPHAWAEETFERFDADIVIHSDSTVEVTEEILANVENIDIKRGIIRTFPVEYRDEKGRSKELGFSVIEVSLDGKETPWKAVRAGRDVEVRIGDPSKIIDKGRRLFMLKYRVERHIGFFEDHDELYWNVTGEDFSFPVLEASCRVALPGQSPGEGFNSIEWYVGRHGAKGNPARARLDKDVVRTSDTLLPGEVLTVVYTWPKGLIAPPPPPARDNAAAQGVIAGATLALTAGWFWYSWRKWGKDPDKRTVIPIFYPPDNLSPAFLRYVRDMRLDQTGFAAAVIALAIKDALKIEEVEGRKTFFGADKGHYILSESEFEPDDLQPEEEALMMQLFPGKIDRLELTRDNSDLISGAMRSLGRNLREANPPIFTRNTDKIIPALALYAAGAIATYPFSGEYPLNTIMISVCGVLIMALGMRLGRAANTGGQNIRQFLGRIFPSLVFAAVGSVALIEEELSPASFVIFIAAAGLTAVMRPLMVSRTERGSDVLVGADGLKLYMETAEKERLEMFNPPEETPELFERLLPYALALGIAKTWGDKFEKILADAGYKPQWYAGPSPFLLLNGAGVNRFASSLEGSLGESIAPKSAPGSTSGMGGGGFAGGGGGGGGARGW